MAQFIDGPMIGPTWKYALPTNGLFGNFFFEWCRAFNLAETIRTACEVYGLELK